MQEFLNVRDLQLVMLRNRYEYPQDVARIEQLSQPLLSLRSNDTATMVQDLGPGLSRDMMKIKRIRKAENMSPKVGQARIERTLTKRSSKVVQYIMKREINRFQEYLQGTKGKHYSGSLF